MLYITHGDGVRVSFDLFFLFHMFGCPPASMSTSFSYLVTVGRPFGTAHPHLIALITTKCTYTHLYAHPTPSPQPSPQINVLLPCSTVVCTALNGSNGTGVS